MFEKITDGIEKQFTDIINLHFSEEEQKSKERKEKEKKIKSGIDNLSKALNLIMYLMLVVIVTRLCVVSILNPSLGLSEAKKIELERKKLSLKDSLKMQNDTILELKKQLAAQKENVPVFAGTKIERDNSTNDSIPSDIKAGKPDFSIPNHDLHTKLNDIDKSGAVVIDQDSPWSKDLPGTVRIGIILLVLLPVLWLMKIIMKFFYFINNLIAPFSIVKIIGLCTFIGWIVTTSIHLFAASSLFEILNKLNPF